MNRCACVYALILLGFGATATLAQADDQDLKDSKLWARHPPHAHSARDLRDTHAHAAHHSAVDIPQYSLYSSFGRTTYSGPFPLQTETHATAKLTVNSATHGQFSLQLDRDAELGLSDRSAGASFRVPLTPRLSVSGAATFSADGAVNPTHAFEFAPGYTLFFNPQGQTFGALSVSLKASRYRTAEALTVNPMFSFGSLASGISSSVAYTTGHLYNAQAAASILSLGQAAITTGPALSLYWTVNPQATLALSVLPGNKTSTLFSTTTETSTRVSASYKFRRGPRIGLAAQHMDTRSAFGFLNRSLNVEISLTVDF